LAVPERQPVQDGGDTTYIYNNQKTITIYITKKMYKHAS